MDQPEKIETGLKLENNSNVQKKRPKSKKINKANNKARLAMAVGDIAKTSEVIKKQRDARSLYLRFQKQLPTADSEVKELHSDIKFVRVQRRVKDTESFSYCFLEFANEQDCIKAKSKLAATKFKGEEMFIDFVGDKSKGKTASKSTGQNKPLDPMSKGAINPYRLLISGLAPGVKANDLKSMFPKAAKAEIPQSSVKKGSTYGFVQFSEPAHAKAAFDDAQNLSIDGHHITVLYAKRSHGLEDIRKTKEKKRKLNLEKKKEKSKKQKTDGSDAEKENRDEDDESEEESDEENIKEEVKVEGSETVEDDDNDSEEEKDEKSEAEDKAKEEEGKSDEENDEDSDDEDKVKNVENVEEEGSDEDNDEESDEEDAVKNVENEEEEENDDESDEEDSTQKDEDNDEDGEDNDDEEEGDEDDDEEDE